MKNHVIILFTLVLIATSCFSQNAPKWEKWNDLIGTWTGEGNGKPGQGSGSFNFSYDLDQKIL